MTRKEAQVLVAKATELKGKTILWEGIKYLVIDFKMICITVEDSNSIHESCRVEALLEAKDKKGRITVPLKSLTKEFI